MMTRSKMLALVTSSLLALVAVFPLPLTAAVRVTGKKSKSGPSAPQNKASAAAPGDRSLEYYLDAEEPVHILISAHGSTKMVEVNSAKEHPDSFILDSGKGSGGKQPAEAASKFSAALVTFARAGELLDTLPPSIVRNLSPRARAMLTEVSVKTQKRQALYDSLSKELDTLVEEGKQAVSSCSLEPLLSKINPKINLCQKVKEELAELVMVSEQLRRLLADHPDGFDGEHIEGEFLRLFSEGGALHGTTLRDDNVHEKLTLVLEQLRKGYDEPVNALRVLSAVSGKVDGGISGFEPKWAEPSAEFVSARNKVVDLLGYSKENVWSERTKQLLREHDAYLTNPAPANRPTANVDPRFIPNGKTVANMTLSFRDQSGDFATRTRSQWKIAVETEDSGTIVSLGGGQTLRIKPELPSFWYGFLLHKEGDAEATYFNFGDFPQWFQSQLKRAPYQHRGIGTDTELQTVVNFFLNHDKRRATLAPRLFYVAACRGISGSTLTAMGRSLDLGSALDPKKDRSLVGALTALTGAQARENEQANRQKTEIWTKIADVATAPLALLKGGRLEGADGAVVDAETALGKLKTVIQEQEEMLREVVLRTVTEDVKRRSEEDPMFFSRPAKDDEVDERARQLFRDNEWPAYKQLFSDLETAVGGMEAVIRKDGAGLPMLERGMAACGLADNSALVRGARVRLQQLSAGHLNGIVGTLDSFNEGTGRWSVRYEDPQGDMVGGFIRPQNLLRIR